MSAQPDIFARLRAPFPADRVSWRVGPTTTDKTRGIALAYIDARDVMDRLDDVCGPAGWQCRYPHANGKTVCEIGILCGDAGWIWKADGAGDTDKEAEKGALSDAFKRAAVRWGIGRYLYDTDSPWVEIEPRGKSYAIKDGEKPKLLRVLLDGKAPAPPARAPQGLRGAMNKLEDTLIEELERQTAETLESWKTENLPRIETLESQAYQRFKDAYLDHKRKMARAA